MKDLRPFIPDNMLNRVNFRRCLILFEPAEALALIEFGREREWEFLGIDGFKLTGEFIQPFQEHSVDFTNGIYNGGNEYDFGVKFIRDRENLGLHFELVFSD